MSRDKYYEFLKELTELCHKHSLYIGGENLKVEDKYFSPIGGELEYDMEGQAYTADYKG
jgi:hypothetical protein